MEITQEEKDFREFMRDDTKTSFIINEHIVEKYHLLIDDKKIEFDSYTLLQLIDKGCNVVGNIHQGIVDIYLERIAKLRDK